MNYLKEIHLFYTRQELDSLSPGAISLWHALMYIHERIGGLKEFTVPLKVLEMKSGLNQRAVLRARTELAEKGYLRFESRSGNQAAVYEIKSLEEEMMASTSPMSGLSPSNSIPTSSFSDETLPKTNSKPADKLSNKLPYTPCPSKIAATNTNSLSNKPTNKSSTLHKQKNLKDGMFNDLHTSYITAFQKEPLDQHLELLTQFIERDGLDPKLVCYALQIAGERDKPFQYSKGILVNWSKKNIKTYVEAIEQARHYYENKGDKGNGKNDPNRNGGLSSIPADFKFYR